MIHFSQAQTLRWATHSDAFTFDPHVQNDYISNVLIGQVYERLVGRDKSLAIVPALALSRRAIDATTWRVQLRPGVKFHDGSIFTTNDVVFSVLRAKSKASSFATFEHAVGEPVALGEHVIEFRQSKTNPIFLEQLSMLPIMSKVWAHKMGMELQLDFTAEETANAIVQTNGTGPYLLTDRKVGISNRFNRNPA